jgi:hypothetical protein
MIRNPEVKEKIYKTIGSVGKFTKFRSKCTEDLNEVVFLIKDLEE